MTATVRVYKSTDSSAPVLTGQVGSLIALLDACLVNGYGSNTAAGWTKPYTSTNIAVFLAGSGTPQPYLWVDDTNATNARVKGYEVMSAHSTGTGDFPTTAQQSGGGYLTKSSTADSTARPWLLLACERAFYLFSFFGVATYGATVTTSTTTSLGFGVFPSYKTSDAYNSFINCQTASATGNDKLGTTNTNLQSGYTLTATSGMWIARVHTQIGTSYNAGKGLAATAFSPQLGNIGAAYPDPVTGAMRLGRIMILEADGGGQALERGYMPGFWGPLHILPQSYFDTFNGGGDLTGKTFIMPPLAATSSLCRAAFETSGSWDL